MEKVKSLIRTCGPLCLSITGCLLIACLIMLCFFQPITQAQPTTATWEVKITVLNITEKIVSIRATRTVDPNDIRTFEIHDTVIETQQQKLDAMDTIWKMYQDELQRETKLNQIIGSLVADAKINLEARE